MPHLPLYRNDGQAVLPLTPFQKEALENFRRKIDGGEFRLVPNFCLCGNAKPEADEVATEKDRYGLPIAMLICGRCGLIRCARILDAKSNLEFYTYDYRSLYVGSKQAPDSFFQEQIWRGKRLAQIFRAHAGVEKVASVFEVGCGAGGILHPFQEFADQCAGCDFDRNYLDYGTGKGLRLLYGDFEQALPQDSADVLILSHVLEHFSDPVNTTLNLIRKIRPGGHLVVEVPGILNLHRVYFNPILYFQNAHYFNFAAAHLKVFFRSLGLEIVYGDEVCIFILRKPKDWTPKPVAAIFHPSLAAYPDKIRRYLVRAAFTYKYGMNPHQWTSAMVKRLRASRLNQLRRKLMGKEQSLA